MTQTHNGGYGGTLDGKLSGYNKENVGNVSGEYHTLCTLNNSVY